MQKFEGQLLCTNSQHGFNCRNMIERMRRGRNTMKRSTINTLKMTLISRNHQINLALAENWNNAMSKVEL